MNRFARIGTAIGFTLLPLLLASLVDAFINNPGLSVAFAFLVLISTPLIIILGIIFSVIGRKAKNRDKYLVLGFGIPALVACVCILVVTVSYSIRQAGPRYVKDPGTPESWQQDQKNRTVISPQEKSPREEIVTIDFSLCAKGNDSFGFNSGSTNFYFEGIEGNKCHFYMGTEIENPNWDGYLDSECNVPTNYQKDFVVDNNGADLTFVDQYCSN